jgi:CheY-like chemotaxis protein
VKDALDRDFAHVAKQQGLSFSVELASEAAGAITTDASRLRQVLKNLLSNAFKFTEEGGVSMHIGPAHSGWSPNNEVLARADSVVAFSISDTGIGITPEQQHLIFEAFAQADGSTARQYGGTGLGLSISRELVRLLGGEVTLVSTRGEGSTFTLYLPRTPDAHMATAATAVPEEPAPQGSRAPAAEPGASNGFESALSKADVHALAPTFAGALETSSTNGEAGATMTPPVQSNGTAEVAGSSSHQLSALTPMTPLANAAGSSVAGSTVLVVDDDFRNMFALAALLKRVDVEAVSAESGQQSLEILKDTPGVDLVLVDIKMPGMDGYATMRAMRSLPSGGKIPLVAFTAKVEDGERQRCIDAGASAYVPKPVNTADLLIVLGEWLPSSTPPVRPKDTVG